MDVVSFRSPVSEFIAAAVDRGALPERPPAELNRYLDATEACVRRYGWARMSPQDIAREAGVNRTTIYRLLGAKDAIFRLLIAREAHRQIEEAQRYGAEVREQGVSGPRALVEVTARAIEQVRAHPTLAKLLADEPDLIAAFMLNDFPQMLEQFTAVLAPLLGALMEDGLLARRDPRLMTQWVVRMFFSVVLVPPPVGAREFLAAGIIPLFSVEGTSEGTTP